MFQLKVLRAWIYGIFTFAMLFSACSLVKPLEKSPAPHSEKIEKSFFKDESGKPRTFACAWAPVFETGYFSRYIQHASTISSSFCSLRFEITETNLIGRLVEADGSHGEIVISIPIKKHYVLEKEKDAYKREKSSWIENSEDHHWSHRKSMHLNLTGLKVHDQESNLLLDATPQNMSVEDVEIEREGKKYWAFTLVVTSQAHGSLLQAKYRFNFLEYDHDENFIPVPYHEDNSKKLNVLAFIEKEIGAKAEEKYTVRWKLPKSGTDPSEAIDVCLFNFPEKKDSDWGIDYKKVAKDAIEDWNELFYKTYKVRPFRVKDSPKSQGYALDLRCNTIAWVGDFKKLRSVPLGIAAINADIKNGKLLWGYSVIYGGLLEEYIKKYTASSFSFRASTNRDSKRSVEDRSYVLRMIDADVSSLDKQIRNMYGNSSSLSNKIQDAKSRVEAFEESKTLTYYDVSYQEKIFNEANEELSLFAEHNAERIKEIEEKVKKETGSLNIAPFDKERTVEDVLPLLLNTSGSDEDKLKNVLKELISHEFGHMIGMGHNFKSHILPKKDSVPGKYYEELKRNADEYQNAVSTIMGYTHPKVTISMDYNEVKPGPHDYLVMRYLYSGEYSVWSGKEEEDFKFYEVPSDGRIPEHAGRSEEEESLKTVYFPSCNNIDQYMYSDPYCDKHVIGTNAKEIVEGKFKEFNHYLAKNLENFGDHSLLTPGEAQSALEYYSLRVFSRIRLFYEYMAETYQDEINKVIKKDELLSNFYKTCRAIINNKELDDSSLVPIFKGADFEFTELCYVNGSAIEKMSKILQLEGSDFLKKDPERLWNGLANITGGDRDNASTDAGAWNSLGLFPVKHAALFTLTNPGPYGVTHGRRLFHVPRYRTDAVESKGRRLYSSLYPMEYTEAIAATVGSNISLEDNIIKRSVLFLGRLLRNSKFNNENSNGYSKEHLEGIQEQTKFSNNGEYVIIWLNAEPENKDSEKVINFKAEMYINRKAKVLGSAYVLPGGKVFLEQAELNSFIYPITPIEFVSHEWAFVIAIRVSFDEDKKSSLQPRSVKIKLKERYEEALGNCLNNGGLEDLFLKDNFDGYVVKKNIASDPFKLQAFEDSVETLFKNDEEIKSTCINSLDSVGLIIATALIIQDIWFPEITNYIDFVDNQ